MQATKQKKSTNRHGSQSTKQKKKSSSKKTEIKKS